MRGGVGSSEPLPLGVYAYLAGLDIYRFEQSQKLTPTCLAGLDIPVRAVPEANAYLAGLDIPVRAVPEANAYLLGGVGHTGSSGPRS
jgi:hypothetical protein